MSYKVGYKRPPRSAQFKAGKSGNPKGRPKKKSLSGSELLINKLRDTIEYRQSGKVRRTSRLEFIIRGKAASGLRGDVRDIAWLFDAYQKSKDQAAQTLILILSEDDMLQ